MTIQSVLTGICTYLGGPYDPPTHTYRTSPISGVGVVRRGWAKRDDHVDYFTNMPPAARTGCQMVVHISHDVEMRRAVGGAHSGMKEIVYDVDLHCFIRSRTPHAEDAQDDVYALRDAIKDQLRADRTLGGAVFQAGEYVDHGHGQIVCSFGQPETKAELTKSYLLVQFQATEFVFA